MFPMAYKALHDLLPDYSSKLSLCYCFPHLLGSSHIGLPFEYAKLACYFLRGFVHICLFAWNTLFQILTWLVIYKPFLFCGKDLSWLELWAITRRPGKVF